MDTNVQNTQTTREIAWNQFFLDGSPSFDFEADTAPPVTVTPPIGPDEQVWMEEADADTSGSQDGTGIDLPDTDLSDAASGSVDLPLKNIDPFQSFDPETLPQVTYEDVETGFMYSNTENAGLSNIHVYSEQVDSDKGSVSNLLFGERRESFVTTETDANGQETSIWSFRVSQNLQGEYSAGEGKLLDVTISYGENQQISGPDFENFEDYYYGLNMDIMGEAEGYDIESFAMTLEVEMEMTWCETAGAYQVSMNVMFEYIVFDGENVYSDTVLFSEEFLTGLDQFNFNLGSDFDAAFAEFVNLMGDAWTDMGEFNDILEALLNEMRENGEFDGVDHMDNPFDYQVDPFA